MALPVTRSQPNWIDVFNSVLQHLDQNGHLGEFYLEALLVLFLSAQVQRLCAKVHLNRLLARGGPAHVLYCIVFSFFFLFVTQLCIC